MKVGIDLGTTFSLIARAGRDGRAHLLPDSNFKDLFSTPSTVYLGHRSAVVGHLVDTLLEQQPDLHVLRFFKRSFGLPEPLFTDADGRAWHPEAVAALVLKKLKLDAESQTGETIDDAVITVPAHFNELQRRAVLSAAALADLRVAGLVEEPVAAALHYGVTHKTHDKIILVYDLGGGTFDVTALSLDENGVYVIAKDGHTQLGGKEFDQRIADMVLEQFRRATGRDIALTLGVRNQLQQAAEEIKIELCLPNRSFVRRPVLLGGQVVEVALQRRDFEAGIRQLLDETVAITMRCLDGAGLTEKDIDALLLVGGSSMVPLIRERLRQVFPVPPENIFFHDPMKAVAYGAALHATQLSGEAAALGLPPEFRGVTGYNLGLKVFDGRTQRVATETLIKKNMPLPARARRTFYTNRPDQTYVELHLVQFIDASTPPVELGKLVLGPLPHPRAGYPVEVILEYRPDGTITIGAVDPQTGIELNQEFGNDSVAGAAFLLGQRELVRGTFINNFGQ